MVDTFLSADCNFTLRPFTLAESSLAFAFDNTSAKEKVVGVSLISKELESTSPLAKLRFHGSGKGVVIGSCILPQPGSSFSRDRIGPFTTNGGYSWTTIFYRGAASSEDAINAYDGNVALLKAFFGPVDASGKPIVSPPLAVHHGRVVPGSGQPILGMFPYTLSGCILHHICPVETVFIGGAGDMICIEEEGGADCLLQQPLSIFHVPLTANLQVNDLRPRGAELLSWFIDLCVEYANSSALGTTQLSIAYLPNLGSRMMYHIPNPTSFDVVFARLPFGGTVMAASFHSHAYYGEMSESSEAFAPVIEGSVILLGKLEKVGPHRLSSGPTEVALLTAQMSSTEGAGFVNNAELRARILNDNEERVLCTATTRFEAKAGLTVARRSQASCDQHLVNRGEALTLITFVGITTQHTYLINYHSHWALGMLADGWQPFRTTTWSTALLDEASCASTPADFTRFALRSYMTEDPEAYIAVIYSHVHDDLLLAMLITFCHFRWLLMISFFLAAICCWTNNSWSRLVLHSSAAVLCIVCVVSIRAFRNMEVPIQSPSDHVQCTYTAVREGKWPMLGVGAVFMICSTAILLVMNESLTRPRKRIPNQLV